MPLAEIFMVSPTFTTNSPSCSLPVFLLLEIAMFVGKPLFAQVMDFLPWTRFDSPATVRHLRGGFGLPA